MSDNGEIIDGSWVVAAKLWLVVEDSNWLWMVVCHHGWLHGLVMP